MAGKSCKKAYLSVVGDSCPKSLMWKLSQVGDLCPRWRYLPLSGRDIWPQGWDIGISAPKWPSGFARPGGASPCAQLTRLRTSDRTCGENRLNVPRQCVPTERTDNYNNVFLCSWTYGVRNVFLLNVRRANWLLLAALVSADQAASEGLGAMVMFFLLSQFSW